MQETAISGTRIEECVYAHDSQNSGIERGNRANDDTGGRGSGKFIGATKAKSRCPQILNFAVTGPRLKRPSLEREPVASCRFEEVSSRSVICRNNTVASRSNS